MPVAVLPGAHSATQGGEVFLGGNYLEIGIGADGGFGTLGAKPAGFFGTTGDSGIGLSNDADGFDNGTDLRIDYFLPGTPEERWSVGYNGSAVGSYSTRDGDTGASLSGVSLVDQSSGDTLQATFTATVGDALLVQQVISFGADDAYFKNSVTLTNTTGETMSDVRFMRSFDPDNTVYYGGNYTTINTVDHSVAEDGYAVVSAQSLVGDSYYTAAGDKQATILLYSSDARAYGSAYGFTNTDPYAAEATGQIKGYTITTDGGIGMTFAGGELAAGASVTFVYYTSLDSANIDDIISDIQAAESGITAIADDTGISASDFITSDTSLTVMGTAGSLEEGDTAQISIDEGVSWSDLTVTEGTWSYVDGRILTEGDHTYMVRVIDTEETLLSSDAQTVTVDTTAPSAAIAISAIADDTGVSVSDFVTSDTSLSVSGTVGALGAGEMAQISIDGGTSWSDLAVASGTWTYADGRTLTDGDYTYDVRVMDTAGNVGSTDTQTVTVDTTAPSTGIAITAISDDTCPVGDFVTGDISLSVSGTVGALGAGEKAQISINGGTSWSELTVTSGTWSYEDSRLLADGDYTYNVRLIDAAGNVGSTDTQVVSVDTIRGTATGDKLTGTAFCDGIYGLAGSDIIKGEAGNDLIDGGTGADKMYGGLGDDTFYVDHSSDYAVEFAGEGNDTVITTLSKYTLATNVENLIYKGAGNTALTGNALDNAITSMGGNDTLDGGRGADTMTGGAGNDTYIVDNALDVVVEDSDAGTDTVKTTLNDYTLADNVENLTYTGITASSLSGNALDNVITGGAKNDTIDGGEGDDALYGGAGNDVLRGGEGNDAFFFNSAPNTRANVDTITDFASGTDVIHLENSVFRKLGAVGMLNASMFVVGTHALDANDYIIYDETSGKLYYDADGSGRGAAVQIALIGIAEHSELVVSDFVII